MLDAGIELLEADDREMMALDVEGLGRPAQYLDARTRCVGLDPDRRVGTADMAQQRSHPHLGHTAIMPVVSHLQELFAPSEGCSFRLVGISIRWHRRPMSLGLR